MRRCTLTLLYEGRDISADIGPDLLSFTFTDKSGSKGEADDVQIVISDRDRRWQGPWRPRRGHVLR
ncbi:MAG: late control protein, partial [Desulfovibrionaceae bacterium]|nr:late control protein [Desulfovibrionaceae bacterium]